MRRPSWGCIAHAGWMLAFAALYVVLHLYGRLTGGLVLVLVCIMCVPFLFGEVRRWNKRRACLRMLLQRADCDLTVECARVCDRGRIEAADAERLWRGLAHSYGVPPAKLLATDTLKPDLAGLVCDVDRDVFFCPLVLSCKEARRTEAAKLQDWTDLILFLHCVEELQGVCGTRVVEHRGRTEVVWSGNMHPPAFHRGEL